MQDRIDGELAGQKLNELLERIWSWGVETVPAVVLVLVVAVLAHVVWRIVVSRIAGVMRSRGTRKDHAEKVKRLDTMTGLLRKVGGIAIWVVATIMILGHVGIQIGPLLAGAGIVGVAVGFGSQSLVKDVISGMFFLAEDQVRVGDWVRVDATSGLVESITVRTIILRDLEGTVHVIPHGMVGTVSNMTKEWSAALLDVGVAYKEDTDRVVEVLREVSEDMRADEELGELILEPLQVFGVDTFADSAVVVRVRLKTQPGSQWSVGREYRRRIKHAFDRSGIEIPFPHCSVYFGEASRPVEVKTEAA
jgi:small conductance mechanosensitive channel